MKPRDKTFNCAKGWVTLFSPPSGVTWGYRFGMNVGAGQALMTPKQARAIAADLIRRADDVESR